MSLTLQMVWAHPCRRPCSLRLPDMSVCLPVSSEQTVCVCVGGVTREAPPKPALNVVMGFGKTHECHPRDPHTPGSF